MSNHNLLIRSETDLERKALGATHMDDLDLIISPFDGALVAVACKNLDGTGNQHVCWRCGKAFNESVPRFKRAEIKWGYSRILLHSGCESGAPSRLYSDNLEGMQYRRHLADAARKSNSIAAAAAGARDKIVLSR